MVTVCLERRSRIPREGEPLVPLVGVDLENERSAVDALTITASDKQTLEEQLTNARHALDLWPPRFPPT